MERVSTENREARIAALDYDYLSQPKERPQCNLCGSIGHPIEVARRDRYGYPATLVVCGRCGLGYLSPRMSADAYADFYSGAYRRLVSAYHGRVIDTETVQHDQRGYATDLVTYLGPILAARPETILDVGGSTGVVAGVLTRALGGRATVLDPAPGELEIAAGAGMETVAGFAEDFDPGERRWDLVVCCQTIDHLLDIRRTLRSLRRLTEEKGRAFVDILDVNFMLRRTGTIEAATKIDHPFYLTSLTATAYFGLVGYTVVAERVSDDGHRGFVLAPAEVHEPDWPVLGAGAHRFVEDVWARRAATP